MARKRKDVSREERYWAVRDNGVVYRVEFNSHGVPSINGRAGKYIQASSQLGKRVVAKLTPYIKGVAEEQTQDDNLMNEVYL